MFNLLKKRSSLWNSIGQALGISFDFRKELRGQALTNHERLEFVLEKWIQSKYPEATWSKLIEILKDLEYQEMAQDVVEYLKNRPKIQF